MITQLERLSVTEIKIETLENKIDDLKVDVKEMHDCLDKTRDDLCVRLDDMAKGSAERHRILSTKFDDLEKFKDRWMYTIAGAIAILGWLSGHSDILAKLL